MRTLKIIIGYIIATAIVIGGIALLELIVDWICADTGRIMFTIGIAGYIAIKQAIEYLK